MKSKQRETECEHGSISWCYSQYNPDFGKCNVCNLKVFAEDKNAAIYDETDEGFNEMVMEALD